VRRKQAVGKAVSEFMISLKGSWLGELCDDNLDVWLGVDICPHSMTRIRVYTRSQSTDSHACTLGGKAVLPRTFQYIPSVLASYDLQQLRHARLVAIDAIGEGTWKVCSSWSFVARKGGPDVRV